MYNSFLPFSLSFLFRVCGSSVVYCRPSSFLLFYPFFLPFFLFRLCLFVNYFLPLRLIFVTIMYIRTKKKSPGRSVYSSLIFFPAFIQVGCMKNLESVSLLLPFLFAFSFVSFFLADMSLECSFSTWFHSFCVIHSFITLL